LAQNCPKTLQKVLESGKSGYLCIQIVDYFFQQSVARAKIFRLAFFFAKIFRETNHVPRKFRSPTNSTFNQLGFTLKNYFYEKDHFFLPS